MSQPTLTRNTYSPPKPQPKPAAPSNQEPWGYRFLDSYAMIALIGSCTLGGFAVFALERGYTSAAIGLISSIAPLLISAAFFSVLLDIARRLRKP